MTARPKCLIIYLFYTYVDAKFVEKSFLIGTIIAQGHTVKCTDHSSENRNIIVKQLISTNIHIYIYINLVMGGYYTFVQSTV